MQPSIELGNIRIALFVSEPDASVLIPKQTHGNAIVRAALCEHRTTKADGIIGTIHDTAFGIHTADCLPLVVTTQTRAAAIHISRHTLVAGILHTLTDVLGKETIQRAYIGPHICEKCFTFEEKGEGIIEFEKLFPLAIREEGSVTHISLDRVVFAYLASMGMQKELVIQDNRCTRETPQLLSYRRWREEGGKGDMPRMITAVYT